MGSRSPVGRQNTQAAREGGGLRTGRLAALLPVRETAVRQEAERYLCLRQLSRLREVQLQPNRPRADAADRGNQDSGRRPDGIPGKTHGPDREGPRKAASSPQNRRWRRAAADSGYRFKARHGSRAAYDHRPFAGADDGSQDAGPAAPAGGPGSQARRDRPRAQEAADGSRDCSGTVEARRGSAEGFAPRRPHGAVWNHQPR